MCRRPKPTLLVALCIHRHDRLAVVFDRASASFTLPLAVAGRLGGLRPPAASESDAHEAELPFALARRMAVETLGARGERTPRLLGRLNAAVADADSTSPLARMVEVYSLPVEDDAADPRTTLLWLTVPELLDPNRIAVARWTRDLVANLLREAAARGQTFPPPHLRSRMSTASTAVIRGVDHDEPIWLVRWNRKWGRYFLVSGHVEGEEGALACMQRELREELGLAPSDYDCAPAGAEPLEFEEWSTSRWQWTRYRHHLFHVHLHAQATAWLRDSATRSVETPHRWVAWRQIIAERCDDGRPISPTTRRILEPLRDGGFPLLHNDDVP